MINTIKDPIIKVIEKLEIWCNCKNTSCDNCKFLIDDECPIDMLDDFWGEYHEHFIDDYVENK